MAVVLIFQARLKSTRHCHQLMNMYTLKLVNNMRVSVIASGISALLFSHYVIPARGLGKKITFRIAEWQCQRTKTTPLKIKHCKFKSDESNSVLLTTTAVRVTFERHTKIKSVSNFEVLMAVTVKIAVFYNMATCVGYKFTDISEAHTASIFNV